MIKFRWTFLIVALLCAHLFNIVISQDIVFPNSNEDYDTDHNVRSNWQIQAPSRLIDKGVKTIKSFFTSSRSSPPSQPVDEPLAMRFQTFQTGSGSSAQANAGTFGFGSGMSGSSASANAGSMNFGGSGSMSGSSANAGSMNYGYQPMMLSYGGSGSSASANAGSSSFNFQPGVIQAHGGSGSSANSGSMSFGLQPSFLQSFGGSGAGNGIGTGGGSGSFASAGATSFSISGKLCIQKPSPPSNAGMKCTQSACQISCLADYKFPNGETTMTLECNNGRWLVRSLELNEIPPCEPVCMPKCLNNGICVAPGQCKCPENYMGPTCQTKKVLCIGSPPLPANSKRSCTSSLCTVTCMKGYKFPDASLSMNLLCKGGKWEPERQGIRLIPDCEPVCESPCLNGGTCLSYNVCQCPPKYRGPQCQYDIANCTPKKLQFNGAYNCSSTGDLISCKLYCPKGISFDFEPASVYTCNYAVGEFLPKEVPKCVYGEGMQVIQLPSSGKIEYGYTNGTLMKKASGKKIMKQKVEEEEEEDEEQEIEETIIKKTKVIKKKKKPKNVVEEEDEEFFLTPGVYQLYMTQELEVTYREPKPSICITWNGNKVKTFDGVTYAHELVCSHVLVQDYIDGTFNVILRSCPYDSVQPCPHALEVFLQNEQFTFENVGGGQVKMFTTKKEIPIPVHIAGLKVTRSGFDVRILLESIPLTITWDTKKFVQIDASASVFNRTAGICGTMDGIMSNDFMSKDGEFHKMPATFVDSWRALNMDKSKEKCIPRSEKIAEALSCETSVEEKANLVCTDLLKNPRMDNCFKMFNMDVLMKNCISDYCYCKNTYERTECICNGIDVLAKDCRWRGVMLEDGWRDWQICPLNCTNGRVYKSCGPMNEPSCGSAIESDSFNCREGCFCPEGTLLNEGICIKKDMCPCRLKGKNFPPNSKIKRDCNTCVCEEGNWKCSSVTCGARCSSVGDPHYSTFDGKRYDFMGKCSYYLMKAENLIVEAENVACSGAISESMNFLPSFTTELPSCTKSLTIKFNDNAGQQKVIKLKQGGFVLVDGFEIAKLPSELSDGKVVIRQASSSFILVDFLDGVQVWWDGVTRAYIDAPASYRGKTQGLCGTFNSNMQDDFLTPEGDIESTVHPFANKWQTKESCDQISDKIIPHPCQSNPENKPQAEKICSKLLKDKVFEECHLFVDAEPYYEDCLYDMCACKGDVSQCACPILASYATECARQGTVLNWRYQVSECTINCPNGQVFEQCGEACTRTCSDLQREAPCKLQCVEGCRCPPGQVLDDNNECVAISMCKCVYKGLEFKPNYKEVRPGQKHLQLCTCVGAKWSCVEAKGLDSVKYPPAEDISKKCSTVNNEIFTTCEPAEPLTCKNMHMNVSSTTAVCRPGCKCKEGFVLDTLMKKCVLPESCSCHHGARSYNDGEQIKEDCNTCVCKSGKWSCTTKECAGTCSLWGDNHFTTFDGREFDFQGVCSYVLAKGSSFSVSIQNVLCGSNGVTCSKTLSINLLGDEPESITFSSDSPVPGIKGLSNEAKAMKKMLTYRSGVFLVAEMPHIGVLLKWDRGTRVYLRLENRWKGKVQGLCGNYNYDALDDFLNPSGGIESNPIIFGHSWKLDDSCASPTEQVDSCLLNPQRKTWAQLKCGLLKSSDFAQCHSEVSVESFYKRCIHDTCSCDQGGDCECLCTALAAYAYACTAKGVNIRWRTPDLCPMQCDPECSNYSPCIESCPVETCDNMMHPLKNERLCSTDNCVEGCKLKGCSIGSVYRNDSYAECVAKSICKPICLQENGITYYEGDVMASDACHTCKCTRGSRVCMGLPCTTDSFPIAGDLFGCETGWTEWINQDSLDDIQNVISSKANYYKNDDIEPLPTALQFKNIGGKVLCKSEFYAAIECRTVVGHNHPKSTGQDVECSLERGLICKGQCFDYEIRVFCDCGDSTTRIPVTTPIAASTVLIPVVPIIPITTPKYEISKVCDPTVPNVEHPADCNKYLQCIMASNGSYVYVEQTCGAAMMFNPVSMVCDWPANVIAKKPKCGKPEEPMQNECPLGYVWSECAIPCRRACNYYGKVLSINGNCTIASNDCLPGCLPQDAAIKCDFPRMWRDWKSCVMIADCTCMGPNNEQLKPGQVVKISECKTCQCINNEFICSEMSCISTPGPTKIISSTVRPVSQFPEVEILITQQRTTQLPWISSSTKKSVVVIEQEVMERPYYLTICDPSIPHVEHPNSCYKFLHCMPSTNGSYIYAVKTCYPDMMFNPISMTCDWPDSVKKIKPQCGESPGEIEIWEETEIRKLVTTASPKQKYTLPIDETEYAEGKIPSYIRICDASIPHVAHPKSCYKYLHCAQAPNGSFIYFEKTCFPDMMYNPDAKTCDWPFNVIKIKPICGENPGETELWTEIIKKYTRIISSSIVYGTTSRPTFISTIVPTQTSAKPIKMIEIPEYIRICDPSIPHVEHPNSCYKFLHCLPTANGSYIYAVKTCYPATMFNPITMICDWPDSVKRVKPKCAIDAGEIEIWEEEVIKKTIVKDITTLSSAFVTQQSTVPHYVEQVMTECNPSNPLKEHPNDCHKYLECLLSPADGVYKFVEKSCGLELMYNPSKFDCDWIENVIFIKPQCQKIEILGQKTTPISISTTVRPGLVTTRKPGKLTPKPKLSTLTPLILLPSTVTPPMQCDESKFVPLLPLIPDTAFSSSSNLGNAFRPETSRLESRPSEGSMGSWSPLTNDKNQFLQVTFPQAIPIYGIIIRGSPLLSQYVTEYKILYSLDDQVFHVMVDHLGNPQIFTGSIDQNTAVKNIFQNPIEAKVIRIYPLSWYQGIALRIELLGCQRDPLKPISFAPVPVTMTESAEPSTPVIKVIPTVIASVTPPSIYTIAPVIPLCDDPLGVENSKLSPQQVKFSSIKDAGSVKTKVRRNPLEIIKLSSARGWMPLADNVNEYVMFDFIENRNLTGVETKGGEYGWVKTFIILYSKDNIIWNKLLDQNGQPKQFIANIDAESVKKNYFPNPINARYLRVQPLKWHGAIELKLEPKGCYLPYPQPDASMTTVKYPEDIEIVTPSVCGLCKGVLLPTSSNNRESCLCYPPRYYNGDECVPQSDCPCFEGHISYPVGETYLTETCAECICQIGGIPQCTQKTCPPCAKGLRRVAPGSCDCKCAKCPPETVICQTSGECIPESSWCDGVQDCPDDEINCLITEPPHIAINRTETITITKKCPDPNCPPGFMIKPKTSRKSKMLSSRFSDDDDEDDKPQHQYYYIKAKYTASYEAILPIATSKDKQDINSEECFEFMCIPIVESPEAPDYAEENQTKIVRCPEPRCPRGYMLKLQIQKTANECAKFTCEPIVDNDAVCNVTGRTFNTFDSTEFKYDICSHLLARDVADAKWNVLMRKNCSSGNNVCTKEIEIKDKVAKYTLILYPSLTVNLDGYYFTVQQLQNSNRKMSFVVSKNGDNLLYVSHTHGIWVTLDPYGDIKLGVSSQYVNQVDGLCGFYSNNKIDDKRTPSGQIASSTVEFGDSWSVSQGSAEDCVPHSCPKAVQDVAMKMCELVNHEIFSPCKVTVNPTRFISTCLETACDCLLTATNGTASPNELEKHKNQCKCSMLKNYVVECMAADENVHLETWRSVHSCETSCPAPLVHQDCYRRSCETTCNNIQTSECANVPGTCFSGCFCPPGTVKKDQTCVPISECRDCVCDGFGKSQYLTYDRKNFTFDGNCTYLLTRDIALKNVHTFQVYATIGPCDTKANAIAQRKVTCTQALHIAYGSHIVHIQRNTMKNLEVIVDGMKISSMPYTQNWIRVTEQGKALSILLPESQVELITMFEAMSFSIKVPSVKYSNKMEGICGNCNGNLDDDLTTNPAVSNLPRNNTPMQNFALSWLADEPKLALNEDRDKCHIDEESECLPLAPETDPCFKILDEEIFGKCHFVVDPLMYVTACQQDLCRTGPTQKGSCESIAAYARECARNGICVDWRKNGFCTMDCVAPYVYTPCGCAETCQSIEAKEKLIKSSPAIKDPKTIEKMKSICSAGQSEGCFCPKGTVLHNGKCLREIECRACDDKGHLPGDVWHLDVCTKCTCLNDSTIQCQKIQCPAKQTICGIGFVAVETAPTGECCKKYACVPEEKPTEQRTLCPQLVLPKCGLDQTNKIINDTNGCSKYICDCIPKSQCKPVQNFTQLEQGFKAIIDTTGCCPISKLVCDKSLCPPKPIQCMEAFYVLEKTKSADDKICCDIYECRPPQNNCIATVNGKKILKKMDEMWVTEDVCEKAQCAFDTNGKPIIKTQRELCNTICQAGFELKPIVGKCCGECIKTKCIADNKLYEIGQTWYSDDNCTTFECNIKDGQTLITSMMSTCPDISSCPPLLRYKDGCCEKCKMESLSQKNCLPESLAENQTIGLIQLQLPPHGNCKNVNGVKGITGCTGSCKSGTKFDPLTFDQLKTCECCSVSSVHELPVELICDDNYKFIKNFNVPASCSCSKCGSEEKIQKLRAAF